MGEAISNSESHAPQVLSASGIDLSYGAQFAVRDAHFSVARGEVAAVTALTLIGARTRTLRAVQCAQVVLPLAIGLALALVAGRLAESSYLVTGGGEVFWDAAGLPLLGIAALGVVGVAAVGTLPLVGRHINPELIRRD